MGKKDINRELAGSPGSPIFREMRNAENERKATTTTVCSVCRNLKPDHLPFAHWDCWQSLTLGQKKAKYGLSDGKERRRQREKWLRG